MNSEICNIYKNSCVENTFFKSLNDENITLISFDIFDTLVFRNVSTPSDIFYKMGEDPFIKSIFLEADIFKNFRMKAENKARKESNYDEIKLTEIYEQLDLTVDQRKKIMEIEISFEEKCLFINSQIEQWILETIAANKKVVLISDIYFSLDVINKIILDKTKLPDIEVFLSSEFRKTKSKKTLFSEVKETLCIEYKNWLHIGDNIVSDINHANSLGINTIHYCVEKNLREQFLIETPYINMDLGVLNSIRKLTAINNCFDTETKRFYYNFGSTIFGPLLWYFSSWLKTVAMQYDIKQISFIMREGKIFKKYFQKRFNNIPCNLIYASRKSTFLASLDEKTFDISEFNFYNYRKLTIEDFHKLFKIELNEYLNGYKDIKFEDANQIYINENNLIQLTIDNFNSQREKITKTILEEKSLLIEYLNSIDIQKENLFVDFGGTGTISMRLTDLLKEKVKLNALMYMHDIGYFHTLPHKTLPFLPLTNKTKKAMELIRRSPEFIEILLNGLEQTTISYERSEEDIIIKKEPLHNQDNGLKEKCEAFEKGIENFFAIADAYHLGDNINTEELSLILSRVIDVPTLTEVKYLGELYYDEGKGISLVEKLVCDEKISKLKKLGITKAYRNFQNDFFYKRNEFHWLQGVITAIDPKYIVSMKGLNTVNNNNEAITSILDTLDIHPEIKKVNIYGAGEFFKELLPHLKERKIDVDKVIDRKAKLSEFDFLDYNVTSIENGINGDNLYPIIVTSKVFAVEITDMLFKYGFSNNLKLSVINYYNGLVSNEL